MPSDRIFLKCQGGLRDRSLGYDIPYIFIYRAGYVLYPAGKEFSFLMAQYGVILGMGLLALVTVVTFALAGRAARSVAQFREEHHESFVRKERQ
jgi:hypothetical protein